jgi:hypothetical protein
LRTAFAAAALALAAGGGSHSAITVRITVTTYLNAKPQTRSFTLGCQPVSGTLPLRARVCGDIARHPESMLDPETARSFCAGGPNLPQLTVTTISSGTRADFDGSPGCRWPGGTALAVYFAAARRDLHVLALMGPRLRCDDDATLLARPTPWASVTACVRGLWTPRTARLIRLAERVPAVAALDAQRLFPAQIGARRCTLLTGSPIRRQPVKGLCGVSVKHVWSRPTITFVETWLRTPSEQARATLQVTVIDGRAQLTGRRGPVPPQLWH